MKNFLLKSPQNMDVDKLSAFMYFDSLKTGFQLCDFCGRKTFQ